MHIVHAFLIGSFESKRSSWNVLDRTAVTIDSGDWSEQFRVDEEID